MWLTQLVKQWLIVLTVNIVNDNSLKLYWWKVLLKLAIGKKCWIYNNGFGHIFCCKLALFTVLVIISVY